MLDRGIDLDAAAIDRKLIDNRRGDYCLEHASLMQRALLAIGFSVQAHLARVWGTVGALALLRPRRIQR